MNIEVTSVARRPEKLSESPSAIQVITAEEIRRSGATSIPEALRLASNLDVAQKNAHDWAVTARGFNTALANKLLVMIDGRTVYTPLFSGVFWDRQDYLLEDIDRIEVISGPGGTQWGANAVNGVINIITKSARDTQGLYVEGGGGTALQDFAGVRYGGRLAPDVYIRAYGKYFDRGQEAVASGADATDSWNMGQGGFRLDASASPRDTLNLQGDFYEGREDVQTGGDAGVAGGNVLGRWTHVRPDRSELSLQVYYDRTHLSDPVPGVTLGPRPLAPAGVLRDNLDTYDLDFQYRFRWGNYQHLVLGLGYRLTHDTVVNAQALAFYPPVLYRDLYSGFVQDEISILENLVFTLGTKLEHNSYTGYEVEPSARLQWSVSGSQTAWMAVSRAVRTPSRIDRDLSEPASGLVLLAGSPAFVSETLIAYELGYRLQLGRSVSASASMFYNDYDSVRSTGITPVTVVPFHFQNNLQGETHGLELSVDYQAFDWWRLRAGYEPINEDLHVRPGQVDINAALNETADPAQRLSLHSFMELPQRIELDAALRWIDSRKMNNGSTIGIVPSYGEMDLRLGWHATRRLELSLAGQNLLHGQHAEYGFPGPTQPQIERAFYGKLRWLY